MQAVGSNICTIPATRMELGVGDFNAWDLAVQLIRECKQDRSSAMTSSPSRDSPRSTWSMPFWISPRRDWSLALSRRSFSRFPRGAYNANTWL